MTSTDIISRIAHLIQQRDVTLTKEVKEIKAKSSLSTPKDEIKLSKAAEAYAQPTASTSEYDKEQAMKVERLKALVSSGNYKMDQEVVDTIAERITNMLV